jgi:hypothetical protein
MIVAERILTIAAPGRFAVLVTPNVEGNRRTALPLAK